MRSLYCNYTYSLRTNINKPNKRQRGAKRRDASERSERGYAGEGAGVVTADCLTIHDTFKTTSEARSF